MTLTSGLAAKALSLGLRILTFGVTVPVGVILAAGLWVHLDKGSAVRAAVDRAVVELVAGADLAAAEARVEALEKVQAELTRQRDALSDANRDFANDLAAAETELELAHADLEHLAATPINDACAVDGAVLERLRNR